MSVIECLEGDALELNSQNHQVETDRSRWKAVVRDVHFWIPLAVLLAGLLMLRWIH